MTQKAPIRSAYSCSSLREHDMSNIPFVRDLAAFTEALGVQNAPVIMQLAKVPWPSDQHRDQFILQLTGVDLKTERAYGG